ncbi:MAG: hypothetical protein ACP5TL_01035 [Candidatus Micrarchaeia archaeon]
MRSLSKIEGTEEKGLSERIRRRAFETMQRSNMSEILELIGAKQSKETDAALKIVMAEKLYKCAITSMKTAQKKGRKMSPAAVVIAAEEIE